MILVCFKEGSLYISLLHFVFMDEIIIMAYMGNSTEESCRIQCTPNVYLSINDENNTLNNIINGLLVHTCIDICNMHNVSKLNINIILYCIL
jgi:hypothetical protein